MHLGFALFNYFPFGGLQRDMLNIARTCYEANHKITIFCGSWEGEQPSWANVLLVPMRGVTNHAKDLSFSQNFNRLKADFKLDCTLGFNKMPGLDFYYAADSCFAEKADKAPPWYERVFGRQRTFLELENAVFDKNSQTHILAISDAEAEVYRKHYGTPQSRFIKLPPGIRRDRIMPRDYHEKRAAFRKKWCTGECETLLLFVGSGFRTKGLDRAIRSLSHLPFTARDRCKLLVVGDDKAGEFAELAQRCGVYNQIEFLGGRNDIEEFLWGSDLLIHLAYRENTGTVLLEAMVAGLPVLTTAACGYAHYVRDNKMGTVIEAPVDQREVDLAVRSLLAENPQQWRERGAEFARNSDIFSMNQRVLEQIEAWQMRNG